MTTEQRQSVIDNINRLMKYGYGNKSRLADTYAYVVLYFNCFGYMPSHKEIGYHFGITHQGSSRRLERLRDLGYLRFPKGADRGFVILALQEGAA